MCIIGIRSKKRSSCSISYPSRPVLQFKPLEQKITGINYWKKRRRKRKMRAAGKKCIHFDQILSVVISLSPLE